MRHAILTWAALLAGCAAEAPTSQPPPRGPRPSGIRWVEAPEAGKPRFVCFVAPGCHECETLEETLEDPEVRALLEGFSCVRHDVSRGGVKLYGELGLTNHPAVALFSAAGEELAVRDFGPPKRELLRLLKAAR